MTRSLRFGSSVAIDVFGQQEVVLSAYEYMDEDGGMICSCRTSCRSRSRSRGRGDECVNLIHMVGGGGLINNT